jgi:hypothetical protein
LFLAREEMEIFLFTLLLQKTPVTKLGRICPQRKSLNHGRPHRLDKRNPVSVERIDEFVGGFDEVLSDTALSDEVYDGEKQEGLMRRAMVRLRK